MIKMGIVLVVITTLCSLVFHRVLLVYSKRFGLMDEPNIRSIHRVGKSRAGGVAIFGAFGVGFLFSGATVSWPIVIAFCVVFLLGLYDDLVCLNAPVKLFWLGVVASILFFGDFSISSLGKMGGIELVLSPPFAFMVLLVAAVGFMNAMNLIDGLDGLAAGVSIVMLSAFLYIGYRFADSFMFFTSLILISSLGGFLFFNWYPSKIFMGDSGSLSLGFVVVVLSIHAINQEYITPVSVLLLAAVPILDTLIVMTRRIAKGKSPFRADTTHIHHILLKQHYANVPKTARVLILLQMVFTYIGLGFKVRDDALILIAFILLFVLFYGMLTPSRPSKRG